MRLVLASIEAEYLRYKAMAEGTFAQLNDEELARRAGATSNSIATIVWHMSGNLASRFTDFLTTDGEKSWRQRDEEFNARQVTKDELLAKWNAGWTVLFDTLATLTDAHLSKTVVVRKQELSVIDALQRSLAHAASHVGQIMFWGKVMKGDTWNYLSIPPGQSAAYNLNPTHDKPAAHAGKLKS
jgi:uncharacterized damage-inducible protein DinB